MASISYEDVFGYFLGRISDYSIAKLDMSDAYDLMREYLHKSVNRTYVRALFSSASLDDDNEVFTFTMSTPVDDDYDVGFVTNLLSDAMVVEWLEPQVQSKVNLSQYFSTGDSKFYAQSSHIAELRGMLEDATLKVRKEIRDRGYIYNSYLEDNT